MASEGLATVLLSGTAGAIAAVLINWWLNRRERDLSLKRDVMRRVIGYRFCFTVAAMNGEPFVALNEASIVFSRCPEVVRSLNRLHRELSQKDRFEDNLVTLIKAMAKACQLPIGELNDYFLMHPFTPGPALHSEK